MYKILKIPLKKFATKQRKPTSPSTFPLKFIHRAIKKNASMIIMEDIVFSSFYIVRNDTIFKISYCKRASGNFDSRFISIKDETFGRLWVHLSLSSTFNTREKRYHLREYKRQWPHLDKEINIPLKVKPIQNIHACSSNKTTNDFRVFFHAIIDFRKSLN